ncbi:MAG: DNA mismatch repair protein MutS, partial [Dehalococcoidia bacterium]
NPNLSQVPPEYIRKQTLINGERYFTTELKEQESLILNTKERLEELETEVFGRVLKQVSAVAEPILATARAIAELDVISGLAEVAVRNRYVRPKLTEDGVLNIKGGRHPVVERNIAEGSFVPNDTHFNNDDTAIAIITGPNMSGKSTYLRQVALITLLAQTGSFVPAESAEIGLVDRIFTRIGAREDLAAGQSTFMVEMVETANILNNATARSLLILDEIGRGTSTYDGLAIARSVVEYIHNSPGLGAKTLFATHYHEMVALADFLPRVKNFNVAVVEEGGRVIFLHRIIPGGVDRSYGIHVAQLAGLPRAVIARAREVLDELESKSKSGGVTGKRRAAEVKQLSFMGQESGDSKLTKEISGLDINSMTPLEALTKLYELQKKAGEKGV